MTFRIQAATPSLLSFAVRKFMNADADSLGWLDTAGS